jgi:tRNA threonylcarbamoyladenosine biosynthesis protein TsaB
LEHLGYKPGDVDYFVCGLGPGSFTGLRIGLAAIKGLCWSLKKPVVGISTLDILAENIFLMQNYQDKAIVVPIIDAKRNLIYTAFYRIRGKLIKRISPYMLLSREELISKLKNKFGIIQRNNMFVFGDAVNLYKEPIAKEIPGIEFLEKDYWYPVPFNLIKLGKKKVEDKDFESAFKIEPIYLYPKECQIRIKSK